MTTLFKTIDDITRTKTSLDGSERIPARDADGDFKILASLFLAAVESEPVGTIKDWDKTFPNTPALPDSYVECDGSVISDSASVYNGYRSRNLNGANVVLSLSWTADAGGAYATVGATDITALAVGDDVTGSGIAADSYISDITGSVVTITDVAAAGTISSTFTNDGRFTRGASTSGVGKKDQMQGSQVGSTADAAGARNYWLVAGARDTWSSSTAQSGYATLRLQTTLQGTSTMLKAVDDGTNGTPRTGTETHPIYTEMVKIMKIK